MVTLLFPLSYIGSPIPITAVHIRQTAETSQAIPMVALDSPSNITDSLAKWLSPFPPIATIVAAIIAAVVAWKVAGLTNNARRQSQIRLSEHRFRAYGPLVELTQITSTQLPHSLGKYERKALDRYLGNWYYSNGNGLLMPAATYALWRAVRKNLTCDLPDLTPRRAALKAMRIAASSEEELEAYREKLTRDQFSLLRTQLKADLAVYDADISPDRPDPISRDLLELCGIPLTAKPWKSVDKEYDASERRKRVDREKTLEGID